MAPFASPSRDTGLPESDPVLNFPSWSHYAPEFVAPASWQCPHRGRLSDGSRASTEVVTIRQSHSSVPLFRYTTANGHVNYSRQGTSLKSFNHLCGRTVW